MVEAAVVDNYGESEQACGFFVQIEENLALPFETEVLGVPVMVEKVGQGACGEIVAICRRGNKRQTIPILDLPLPAPPPRGAEWIEAYRHWAGGG